MISASRAAPPWLFSSISLRAHVRRSARSLWVFSPCLKMFTLLASLVVAGSLFQLFTTLWLKKCPLASVITLFVSIRLLSLVALVSFSILCCHPEPLVSVYIVHLHNNFICLYHVTCPCPPFCSPEYPVRSPHTCVLSILISFSPPAVALSPKLACPLLSMGPTPGLRTLHAAGHTARTIS